MEEAKYTFAELACRMDTDILAHALFTAMQTASINSSVAIHESEIVQLVMHDLTVNGQDRLFPTLCNLLAEKITEGIAGSSHLSLEGRW